MHGFYHTTNSLDGSHSIDLAYIALSHQYVLELGFLYMLVTCLTKVYMAMTDVVAKLKKIKHNLKLDLVFSRLLVCKPCPSSSHHLLIITDSLGELLLPGCFFQLPELSNPLLDFLERLLPQQRVPRRRLQVLLVLLLVESSLSLHGV